MSTPEELLELAKKDGNKLSEDEPEAVSGGWYGDWSADSCLTDLS